MTTVTMSPEETRLLNGRSAHEQFFPKVPKLKAEQLQQLLSHPDVVAVENYPKHQSASGDRILRVPQALIDEFAKAFRPEDFELGNYTAEYNIGRNLLGRLIVGSDGGIRTGQPQRYYVSEAKIIKEIASPGYSPEPDRTFERMDEALRKGTNDLNNRSKTNETGERRK